MIQIIGFEGALPENALVGYGAAAVLLPNGDVRNSLSRATSASDDSALEGVTKFRSPLDLDDQHKEQEIVVLALNHTLRLTDLFVPGSRTCITQKREKPYSYYFFEDRKSFAQHCIEAAWDVTDAVMEGEVEEQNINKAILACLVLTPRDPALLALRVHYSQNREAASRSADRLLSPESRITYESILKGLSCPTTAEYVLKYENGIAGAGGLDLEVALTQLKALHNIHHKLEPELRKRLPFITKSGIPEPRFQTLKAASAEFGFGFLGSTLQERLIRYFEFQLFAEIFAGQIPAERRREPARPPPVPRPAGLQVRDAREKARLGLRGLAFRLGISVVELGEIERGLRSPAELWWKLREVLPGLGDMPPWTPSTPANTFAIPHPTGRCTCGGGGGGTCGWCKMDQHRTKREDRRKARATSTKFQRLADSDDYQGPTGEEALALLARDAERLRQHEAHQRKQARRRRRGF